MRKKILCWFTLDFTQFFLVNRLSKLMDAEFFAIYDLPDKTAEFFKEQQITDFKKSWFFHDEILKKKPLDLEYLKKFEEETQIDLMKLAINERTFYRFYNFHKFSHEEILSILQDEVKFFQKVVEEVKPDYVITREPGMHHHELFYEFCKKKNIIPLMLTQMNLGYKCCISTGVQIFDKEYDNTKRSNRSFSELMKYRKEYDYLLQNKEYVVKEDRSSGIKNIFKAGFEYFLQNDNTNVKTHYTYFGRTKSRVLLYTLSVLLKTKYRQKFINKNLVKFPNYSDDFVYYPMSLDLERNMLVKSPLINNQIETIRQIAKSLPPNYKLFVKEHPHQIARGWREIREYKEVMDIPNVKFIHPSVPVDKLLKKCKIVICVGGSTGLEAAFYEKPTIVFSDVFYSELASVKKITDIIKLPETIRDSLKMKVKSVDLSSFVDFIEENTFEFDQWKLSDGILKKFYKNGNLHDCEILEEDMLDFLKENQNDIDVLVKKFLNKFQSIEEVQ